MSRTLTDADIEALAAALKPHTRCNVGLTQEEVADFRAFVREDLGPLRKGRKAFDAAAGIVGKVVLTILVVGLVGMFTKGFWISLATGIRNATVGK